jgi:protease-4
MRLQWLVLVFVILGLSSAQEGKRDLKVHRYAVLEIDEAIAEDLQKPPLPFIPIKGLTFPQLIKAIEEARQDKKVQGLWIRLVSEEGLTFPRIQELHRRLKRFKENGKRVYVSMRSTFNMGYLFASAADGIIVNNPHGIVWLTGLSTNLLFFKGLLDKLGIECEGVQAGQYKGALEHFTREGSSPALKEMINSILDSYHEQMLSTIANLRKIPKDDLKKLIDKGPFLARDALKEGLVDYVGYEKEYLKILSEKAGAKLELLPDYVKPERKRYDFTSLIGLMKFFSEIFAPKKMPPKGPKIAILHIQGIIMDQENNLMGKITTPHSIKLCVDKILKDRETKGVIIRINSPGGSVIASDLIWNELKRLTDLRPTVVSMGDMAASGGYYVAVAADTIIAEPTTLTGSIGVWAMFPNLQGMCKKLGVTHETYKRGKHADFGSLLRKSTEEERQILKRHVDEVYRMFLERVADGRKMGKDQVQKVAQGRIWTGEQALKNGLVDRLGGLADAIKLVRKKAKIDPKEKIEFIVYPEPKTLLDILMESFQGYSHLIRGRLQQYVSLYRWLARRGRTHVLALVPFVIDIR